jgi:hypothetical protein
MRAAERRHVRRAKALLRSGDRAGALAELTALEATSATSRARALPEQLVMALTPFHCERLQLDLVVGECIDRREDAYRSGRRAGARKHLECQTCAVGQAWRARLPGYHARAPSNPREVLSPQQRKAKARRTAASWREEDGCDPLAEAASLTPDDPVRVG